MAASIVHKYMYISIIFNKYITIYIHIYIGYIQTFETYIIYLLLLLFFTKSYLTLCNPIDVSPQVPRPWDFSRSKYWSGSPFPSSGDFSHPGIEPASPTLAGRFFTTEPSGKLHKLFISTFTLNYLSSKSKFLKRGSDWSNWGSWCPHLIHLFVRGRGWQKVNCPLFTQSLSQCNGYKHPQESLGTGRKQEASEDKIGHYQHGPGSSSFIDKDEDLKN